MNNIIFNHKHIARWLMICIGLWYSLSLTAQGYVEYFWNNDPGMGKGTKVAVNSGLVQFELSTESLPAGVNLLGIRVIDGNYYSSTLLHTVLKASVINKESRVEYFWDVDPGMGNAIEYPVTVSGEEVTIEMAIPTDTLSAGAHLLGIRVFNGGWSQTYHQMVAVASNSALVDKMEYFWDEDPGYGKATQMDVTYKDSIVTASLLIPTDVLTTGVHLFGYRVGSGDVWSQTYTSLVAMSANKGKLESLEYFWDNDPGIGNAYKYEISAASIDSVVTMQIPTDTLSTGVHLLGIRSCYGGWSQTNLSYVAISGNDMGIEEIEYFWDDDPGIGEAIPYAISTGVNDSVYTLQIPTDTLSAGIHLLGIRSRCGEWSQTTLSYIAISKNGGAIERVEYYWDEDPGYGNAIELPFSGDTVAFVDAELPAPESYGTHVLHIRAMSNGIWSAPLIKKYCMNATPVFELDSDTLCVGEQFIVYNMTEGAADSTAFMWDMNGDGKIDYTGSDDFVYSYTKAGNYMISLGVKTVGDCVSSCFKAVTVLSTDAPKVTLKASTQSVCEGDEIRLQATPTNAGDKPMFEWLLNDSVIAVGPEDTLMVSGLKDYDKVQVRVISSNPCASIAYALSSKLTIRVRQNPDVNIATYFPVYTTESSYILSGGTPEGGKYYINGKEASLFNPKRNEVGTYMVSYSYANSYGCVTTATTAFELKLPTEKSLLLGDVNKDEVIDIMDILCEVDYVYGMKFPTFNMLTADINKDKGINVADIVGISGIILDDYSAVAKSQVRTSYKMNRLISTDAFAKRNDDAILNFKVESGSVVSGLQFDITMPEGIELSSNTEGLIVRRKPNTEENTYTVMTYSTQLKSIRGSFGIKASVPSNFVSGEYPIEPVNVVMVTNSMDVIETNLIGGTLYVGNFTNVQNNPNGIQVIIEKSGVRIMNAIGQVMTITDSSGRFIIAEEMSANNQLVELTTMQNGTYLIEITTDDNPVITKILWKQ